MNKPNSVGKCVSEHAVEKSNSPERIRRGSQLLSVATISERCGYSDLETSEHTAATS